MFRAPRARLAPLALSLSLAATAALAEDPAPKLGPNAIPVTADYAYVKSAPAPDYWAFGPFVKPQFTTSACSIAAVTGAVNGLRGLPANAEDTVTTQPEMLELVGNAEWANLSAEGGDGVKFDQLAQFTQATLDATDMKDRKLQIFHPAAADEASLAELRAILAENEKSAEDAALLYFNQGVVTGDWDGPHVSVIGAYDAATDRVLILEVDQEWYVPYWTPVPILLDAMLKPTSAEHGVLEGETGGLVWIRKAS